MQLPNKWLLNKKRVLYHYTTESIGYIFKNNRIYDFMASMQTMAHNCKPNGRCTESRLERRSPNTLNHSLMTINSLITLIANGGSQ